MKLWWELSAQEKLKRTEWVMAIGVALALLMGLVWTWLWFLMLPVLGVLYIGTQLHIKNQITLEKEKRATRDFHSYGSKGTDDDC
ncbi:MAG: hypothetical protein Kow0097_07780 [Candidatus Bipolaricaulota bacterium]|nr:hypothetical protein [Candidatus Bipolaricaulota bacterium]